MTSAPRAASIAPAYGPEIHDVSSTTLMPLSNSLKPSDEKLIPFQQANLA
jgi:hypothetical protein